MRSKIIDSRNRLDDISISLQVRILDCQFELEHTLKTPMWGPKKAKLQFQISRGRLHQ